jgi:hypothetical protein
MFRKTIAYSAFMAMGFLLFVAAAHAGEVAQGKCLNYQKGSSVAIEEYDINFTEDMKYGHPTGIESSFDISLAKIGKTPEPGDMLRIAYVVEGTSKKATKVMNMTKQDIIKGK